MFPFSKEFRWVSARFSLIQKFFSECDADRHDSLLTRLLGTAPGGGKRLFAAYSAPFLPGVLDRLKEEQDFKEFRDLHEEVQEQQRQEFVLSRVGGARAKAEHFTPTALRNLRPAHARVSLVWQLPMRAFQGYYPIPAAAATKQTTKQQAEAKQKQTKKRKTARVQTHWSRSRSYGEKRTKLAALTQIVRWLWKAHGQCGFDTCHNNIPCVAWWVILGLPQ